MRLLTRFLVVLQFVILLVGAAAQLPSDPVLTAMKDELRRSMATLKQQPVPPYFLSYQLTDNRAVQIGSAFGTLTRSDDNRTRTLDIDLRVGDYALDNTHAMRGGSPFGPIDGATAAAARRSMARWCRSTRRLRTASGSRSSRSRKAGLRATG